MVKNGKKINAFHNNLIAREKLSYKKSMAIFEGLYREARALRVINSHNILDGIEVDIRIARILNSLA